MTGSNKTPCQQIVGSNIFQETNIFQEKLLGESCPSPRTRWIWLLAGLIWVGLGCRPILSVASAGVPPTDSAANTSAAPSGEPVLWILPPTHLEARDAAWDDGSRVVLGWPLEVGEGPPAKPLKEFRIYQAAEPVGPWEAVAVVEPKLKDIRRRWMEYLAERCEPGREYHFRLLTVWADGSQSAPLVAGPVQPRRQLFDGNRIWLAGFVVLVSGLVLWGIHRARSGRPVHVRRIAGLEAVQEAIGRATEMGRPCLFIPGIQDMNEIQTIAGLTILGRVAQTAATYAARVEVPTCRSLVMTAARDTVQAAYLAAGRPDAYRPEDIYYVTDEQFGYVAHVTGLMVRQRPAACFYMGAFFAESLILAETGNAIGAIQVAGTAMPSQLPFFVAACDYTLIGEEFFAASAYLSGQPDQLGTLWGQDMGKLLAGSLILAGSLLATLAALTGSEPLADWTQFLQTTLLQ
ncbi:MAG: hypothetical protein NZ602_00280 [Thermoguttaceae bacterium]|nr:hypothetical protein [Thermoguttaceae bacterium]MDW8038617.1 hypothetical protein [Thermoguttaceae bacterium]